MNKNDIGIKQLISLTEADMAKVNSLIIQKTMSNTEMIPKISQYLISSGGKRLRPMLTIASSLPRAHASEIGAASDAG